MGLRDAFRFSARVAGGDIAPSGEIVSPWRTSSNLAKVVVSDIVGLSPRVATRADAMRVPAVTKGRALIAGTLSRYPLAKYRHEQRIDADAWMYRTNTGTSPQLRMLHTLDDLIFHGVSLWALQRGGKRQILDAVRILPDEWEVDPDTLGIIVRGESVRPDQVILFEGPQPGLLSMAAEDIHASLAMKRAWASRVRTPVPLVHLHSTDAHKTLDSDEAQQLIDDWEAARQSESGATAYTSGDITVEAMGEAKPELFVEGRNAERLDWANFLNLPGSMLDGSTATASLTYSTKEGSRAELVDYSLSYWANPIAARLSMDDVVPAGQRVEFDLSWLSTPIQPAAGPVRED